MKNHNVSFNLIKNGIMILSVILQQDVFVFLNKILGLNKNAIVALFVIMKLIMSSVIF